MISAIVFSRDRACQLDLLLSSLALNAAGMFSPLVVLWHGTSDEFREGYERCASEHPAAEFIQEDGLTYQVRSLLRRTKAATFFTDDSVLYREITLEPILILSQKDVLCFSLRLGENTTVCYPYDSRQIVPASPNGAVRIWKWKGAQGDFGYPMSLDGHIFRSSDLSRAIAGRNFGNPNFLEAVLMQSIPIRPLMASFQESALVGVPVNRVNTTTENRYGQKHPVGVRDLNERYLGGQRIRLGALDFSDIRGAHQEIPLVLR